MNPIAERIISYLPIFDRISKEDQIHVLINLVGDTIKKIFLNPVTFELIFAKCTNLLEDEDYLENICYKKLINDDIRYNNLQKKYQETENLLIESKILYKNETDEKTNDKYADLCDKYVDMIYDLKDEINEMRSTLAKEFDDKLKNEIMNIDWDFVPFPNCKTLIMYSDQTGNSDYRGGGVGSIPKEILQTIKFRWQIENPTGITLKDFTECVYRLKGSKYDHWYERYYGFTRIEQKDSCMTFRVEFDYGS